MGSNDTLIKATYVISCSGVFRLTFMCCVVCSVPAKSTVKETILRDPGSFSKLKNPGRYVGLRFPSMLRHD